MKLRKTNRFAMILLVWGLLIAAQTLQAQTDRCALEWNANTENDVYLYRVFKGNDPNHLTQIDSVFHPDTTFTDLRIEKGVQYYYGIKAVDFSLNASPMSDLLSVAVPKVSGFPQSLELPSDTTVIFQLDNYVTDPDNGDAQLTWSVSGFSQIQTSISNDRRLTLHTPQNWNGSEKGLLKVEDPDHLFDQISLTITSRYSNQAPIFTTNVRIETDEDKPVTANLAHYVQDADSPKDKLQYSVKQAEHVQLQLKDSLLTITPDKDWYGQQNIRVYVQDETGLKDSTDLKLIVQAVDDAPVLAKLPAIRMKQDSTVVLELDPYVWDVDNSRDELQWSFENYSHVTLSFSESDHRLTIQSPINWSGFEYIKITVKDPDGKASTDTLVVQVLKVSYAPQLSNIPEIIFNEDEADLIKLNDYVYDKDTPLANLYWEISGNNHIHFAIDYVNKTVTLSAEKDWFGSEQFWLKVIDPDQHADSAKIKVTVLPVNDPPQFKNFPAVDLSKTNPKSIPYRKYIEDVDDDVNSLYLRVLEGSPFQITLNNKLITFQAAEDWYGSKKVRLVVQDPSGAADTSDVLVYRQNLETAPKIVGLDSLHIEEDQKKLIDLSAHVTDPDNSVNEISWAVQTPSFISANYDASAGSMTLKPASNWNGQGNVVLKATDPQGHFDFDTLEVVVLPVNDPPQIKPIPDCTMLAGTYFTLDLSEYITDPDGYDDLQKVELLNDPRSFIGYFLDEGGLRATFFAPQGFHGQETFMVRATDRAGVQAASIFILHVQASSIFASVQAHPFGSGDVMHLDWRSKMPTRDRLEYSLDWSFDQSTPLEAEYSTEHHVVLENLKPNKTYHYRVISVDEQGLVITNPDSVFKTGAVVKGVNVFPIPFRVNDPESGDGIYFTNLGKQATIRIYNLLGDLVFKAETDVPIFKWDVKNGNGQPVHSGLYFYHIQTQNKKYKGKIIIIR